jgi:hypothetical protein
MSADCSTYFRQPEWSAPIQSPPTLMMRLQQMTPCADAVDAAQRNTVSAAKATDRGDPADSGTAEARHGDGFHGQESR